MPDKRKELNKRDFIEWLKELPDDVKFGIDVSDPLALVAFTIDENKEYREQSYRLVELLPWE